MTLAREKVIPQRKRTRAFFSFVENLNWNRTLIISLGLVLFSHLLKQMIISSSFIY